MQSFLIPQSTGGTPAAVPTATGASTPTQPGESAESIATVLQADSDLPEFADVFAADLTTDRTPGSPEDLVANLPVPDADPVDQSAVDRAPEMTQAAEAETPDTFVASPPGLEKEPPPDIANGRNVGFGTPDVEPAATPAKAAFALTPGRMQLLQMSAVEPSAGMGRPAATPPVELPSTAQADLQNPLFKTSRADTGPIHTPPPTGVIPPTQQPPGQVIQQAAIAPPKRSLKAQGADVPAVPPTPANTATPTPMAQTNPQIATLRILSSGVPHQMRPEAVERSSSAHGEVFALGRSEGPGSGAPASGVTPLPPRADLAMHMARQIADVAHHMPARPVEITLSPEELGRVRLSVSTQDAGIVLNIVAERPETVDLLRRHIGQLGQQLQSLGYENIAFSFSGGSDAQTSQEQDLHDDAQRPALEETDTPPLEIALATGAATGVDIRL